MTRRKLSFIGVLTTLSCLLFPPAVRLAGAQTATKPAPTLAQAAAQAQAQAQAPAQTQAPVSAVKTPFLWRIEGPVPSYLYGTIHVPDAQVTVLPPAVEKAFASSAAVFTEIPMDGALQIGMMGKMMLPGD